MRQAIALGRTGLGQVAPNPAVGCLIVQPRTGAKGTIVGRGVTQSGGRPHAEVVALAEAGDLAQGAIAYVSFEPCAHTGQTPPCASALAAAGVSRVVSALEDPDPRVAGKGHQMLRDAGLAVDIGVEADAARDANIGFLTRIATGRPYVQLKLAVSADGMIAAKKGAPTAITGPETWSAVQLMRAEADAIMIGQGTWAADDPMLTCRGPGLVHRSPVRIVLDARCELPPTSKLAISANQVPLWVVSGNAEDATRCTALVAAGAHIVPGKVTDGRIDLPSLLDHLGADGLTRLLVEGGGQVAATLLEAGLVDELVLFRADKILGPDGVPAFGVMTPDQALTGFTLASEAAFGADRRLIYNLTKS